MENDYPICDFCGRQFINLNDLTLHQHDCNDLKRAMIKEAGDLHDGKIWCVTTRTSFMESFTSEFFDNILVLKFWYNIDKPGLPKDEKSTTLLTWQLPAKAK